MLVLPSKYVNEMRMLPSTIASPTVAHAHNLMGRHTNMNIILRNNLHFRTLQLKLTPNLSFLTAPMQEELNYAIDKELPNCEDWVIIKPYHSILKLVARISARIFLGLPLCRDENWLEISTEFTENGEWDDFRKGHRYIRKAKKLLVPEIKRRRQATAAGKPSTENSNLLSWMMEIASEAEGDAASLAHLEVVMSLDSIHTSQMNAVHVLYDLVARPEYITPIRDEIREVSKEDGAWMKWEKPSFTKLRKLDSFMRESQRFNPPTLISMHRVMMQDHQFADGTVIPRNAHVSMAVNAIQNDPEVTPEPRTFDGLRYYKLRQQDCESHLHQFSTTQEKILNFGHGANSCPGRFFASLEIKIILVRLIMDYEYKFPDGKGRPENVRAHEFIFPNPEGELLMRRRSTSERLAI
ncbi:hypothetical protein N7G274_008770 [Stereocaulon virgatum]|uniref:Cytochrome P450 n=1 Tax=Stereocaulon virgatum TaxID=373712 RepID=A0ABR4A0B9_9LECA